MSYVRDRQGGVPCGGVQDWFSCLRCEHICTSRCPLEGDDVMGQLAMCIRAEATRPSPESK